MKYEKSILKIKIYHHLLTAMTDGRVSMIIFLV